MTYLQDIDGNEVERLKKIVGAGGLTRSEHNYLNVLVWGITLMTRIVKIKKINTVNKDWENPEIEYKQKQMNRKVFEQNSFE